MNNEIKSNDIYFADLELSTGKRLAYTRPVLIIKEYKQSKVIVAPLTNKVFKDLSPTQIELSERHGLKSKSIVIFEETDVIDKNKLLNYMGSVLDEETLKLIDKAIENAKNSYSHVYRLLKDDV